MNTLQNIVSETQTNYTIDIIRMALNTQSASVRTWIVVEDIDDVNVYEKLVNRNFVTVLPSTDYPAGNKGCKHVEKIVDEVLTVKPSANVIGVRDSDCTRYEKPEHVFPQNIFTTDERDVEMMLLGAASVQDSLRNWSEMFPEKLYEAILYTRFMGYLRICNDICNLGCNFKKKVKLAAVWEHNTHQFSGNWREVLLQRFLDNCGNADPLIYITEREHFEAFVCGWGLENEPWQNVCQGHDTVWALSVLMINNVIYSEANIMSRMTNDYALDDFKETQLYARISSWAAGKGISVF